MTIHGNGFRVETVPVAPNPEGRRAAERAAVAELLARLPGAPAEYSHSADGRPYIDGADYDISISHSTTTAAMAWSRSGRIGVDVENARGAQLRRVAQRFLTESELEACADEAALLRAWTIKEAAYKALPDPPADLRQIRLADIAPLLAMSEPCGGGWISVVLIP